MQSFFYFILLIYWTFQSQEVPFENVVYYNSWIFSPQIIIFIFKNITKSFWFFGLYKTAVVCINHFYKNKNIFVLQLLKLTRNPYDGFNTQLGLRDYLDFFQHQIIQYVLYDRMAGLGIGIERSGQLYSNFLEDRRGLRQAISYLSSILQTKL